MFNKSKIIYSIKHGYRATSFKPQFQNDTPKNIAYIQKARKRKKREKNKDLVQLIIVSESSWIALESEILNCFNWILLHKTRETQDGVKSI